MHNPIGRRTLFGRQVPTLFGRLYGKLDGFATDLVFRSQWNTNNTSAGSSASNQVSLPLVSTGTYNFQVDWGDGTSPQTITAWNQAETTHTYSTPGTYNIEIAGQCDGWQFANSGDRLKLLSVSNWGELRPVVEEAFWGCANMTVSASDLLDISGMTNMRNMFRDTLFNQPISDWDVSSVTIMTGMFKDSSFNQPIGTWNVANVTDMQSMFENTPFNQDLSEWVVTSVGSFNNMFAGSDFNQPIGAWDVSGVTSMGNMFINSAFNQDVSSWVVSSVANFSGMFSGTPFNQNINGWNVGSATNLSAMFLNATAFNQPLNSWNVSSCTNFASMFQGASVFDQPLNSWTFKTYPGTGVGELNMANMFRSTIFNQDISGWVMTNVGSLSFFLFLNTTFNQNVSAWDTTNVEFMGGCFRNTNFDPVISGWNISTMTDASTMFRSAAQSTTQYDALLIGWEGQPHNLNVAFETNAKYTSGGAAETARTALIADGWTIVDGGAV